MEDPDAAEADMLTKNPVPRALVVENASNGAFTPGIVRAWEALRVLNTEEIDPAEACRPFSADRNGIVLSEGAAVMVLESVGIRDGRDLDVLLEILTTSPVERNRLRAAEVLSRNRATAASLLASASAPSVDARSVTLNIGAGEGAMLPGVPDAVRAALAAFRKDAGGDGKASP